MDMKLSDRVEALEGPDRETELAIWAAIDPANAALGKPLPWLHCYTASLDAAMMLVPEGWGGSIHFSESREYQTVKLGRSHPTNATVYAESNTPAIALTAAALRARGL